MGRSYSFLLTRTVDWTAALAGRGETTSRDELNARHHRGRSGSGRIARAMIRIVFLDLDGVLRRRNAPLYELEADLVARFERAVRQVPDLRIVISSSWRDAYSLAEIREHFAVGIAERIVGVTPSMAMRDDYDRHREVLAYLERHEGEDVRWLAIDDDPENYPPGAPVILVDCEVGFDDAAAAAMLRRLG
jgi:Swiss Army Knife RNA repair-like protein